jgi:RND family efflux transporter MFP subunit
MSMSWFRPFTAGACVLAVVLLSLGAAGCSKTPEAASQPIPKVTVTPVVSRDTTDFDEYIGRTEASEIVEVRARVFGYLKSAEFKDGDYVEKGQKLFTVEDDEYDAINKVSQSRIELAKTRHDLAVKTAARKEPLVKSGAVTKQEYDEDLSKIDEALASIKAAEADANRTAVDLKYTELFAPISGRIDRAYVTPGNLLTGGTTNGTILTKIVNEQPMHVYFDVDERSLLRYMKMRAATRDKAPGSLRESAWPCFLQLADEKEFSHAGVLDFASAEVNASTGTAKIRAVFENADRVLASGLFVRVRIPLSKDPHTALMIPERALATDLSVKYVYVVGSDKKAERRNVQLGRQEGELRIVTDGLKEGEEVITKGVQRVRPDQDVEVERADAAASPESTASTEER